MNFCLSSFITPIWKSLVVPVIWLARIGATYSRIAQFFALNRIFFPANEEATLKTKQPIRFQGLFKVTDQIAGKWKTKSIVWQILLLLFPKPLFFILFNRYIYVTRKRAVRNPSAIEGQIANILTSRKGLWAMLDEFAWNFRKVSH